MTPDENDDEGDEMHPVHAAILGSMYEIATHRNYVPDPNDRCDRCGLPFDRSGRTRTYSKALLDQLRESNPEEYAAGDYVNTHCPRFAGDDEMFDCEGAKR